MTLQPHLLVCNPDEPDWIHGPSMAAEATAPFCRHKVRISAAGVSILLSTPGLKTCCFMCIPPDAVGFAVPPEIREHFRDVAGKELDDDLIALVQFFASIVQERNRRRQ